MVYNDNGKVLTLEKMSNMSIDEIVNLYRSGHRIENTAICEDIGCVSPSKCETISDLSFKGGLIIGALVTFIVMELFREFEIHNLQSAVKKECPDCYVKLF